ncbi:hypothetical protein GKQ38_01415 [Candidatus Nanohaloarchaea archaeon]|nr:hypothetical protein GKQ38_01415 [Candidatus Nanohaloarchaea archaeon]
MIAGLILKDTPGRECGLAFLDEELETYSVESNEEIIELLDEKNPEVLAADVSDETSLKEFNKNEEELKEEGHIFTPVSHEGEKVKRFEALKAGCRQHLGQDCPEFIRFEPQITADELAIHSDDGLRSFGVETEDIHSADEFDAALGAITARFYQQGQFKDLGIVVPQNLDGDEEAEESEDSQKA